MTSMTWIKDTLMIGNKEIPIKHGTLPQRDLTFYAENPRIYSLIRAGDEEPTQSEIQRRLSDLDHVKQLVQSIRANGGLTDPLIVREGDLVVLEGNSRLAAYRLLAKSNPVAWGNVKVNLLPANIEEKLIFALLGQYHIIGRKDWQPYEQAGYMYRRIENHGSSPQQITNELGLTLSEVKRLVKVYKFMIKHDDDNPDRWSHYEEYLKSMHINRARNEHSELDDRFVKAVKSNEIPHAIDVRQKMAVIAKGGNRSVKLFLSESEDAFNRAYDSAVDRGAEEPLISKIQRFKRVVDSDDVLKNLKSLSPEQLGKVRYDIKKIQQRLGYILKEF